MYDHSYVAFKISNYIPLGIMPLPFWQANLSLGHFHLKALMKNVVKPKKLVLPRLFSCVIRRFETK